MASPSIISSITIVSLMLCFITVANAFNTPCPANPFSPTATAKTCQLIGNYFYDPCNCDAGYWCGCSSSDASQCTPGGANWIGHYTSPTGVVTQVSPIVCPFSFYCPGINSASTCPALCPAGSYCPTATSAITCPDGSYCPTGSVAPTECPPLSSCSGTGNKMFSAKILILLCIGIAILFLGTIVILQILYAKSRRAFSFEDLEFSLVETPKTVETIKGDIELGNQNLTFEKPSDKAVEVIELDSMETLFEKLKTMYVIQADLKLNISFENVSLTIDSDGEAVLQPPLVDGKSDEMPEGLTILQGVSGELEAGKVCAVMGGSGAGKTTFLNCISGKIARSSGTILVNGVEHQISDYKRVIGFVPQEDVMHADLTVEENIMFNAEARLPRDWSYDKKMKMVEIVMEILEIKHIRLSIVGDTVKRGISGGQRKRVNIAMELVACPSALFLDEPTSGLDSKTSATVMRALKAIAKLGVNVITVLHQPSAAIFKSFDTVLFLGTGGRTCFLGSPDDAVEYLTNLGYPIGKDNNPADYCIEVISSRKDDFFATSWEDNQKSLNLNGAKRPSIQAVEIQRQNYLKTSNSKRWKEWFKNIGKAIKNSCRHVFEVDKSRKFRELPSTFHQFLIFLRRAFAQRLHSPIDSVIPIALVAVAAVVMGVANGGEKSWYQGLPNSLMSTQGGQQVFLSSGATITNNIPQLWLTCSIILCLVASVTGCLVFGYERSQFFREASTGCSTLAYYWAKDIESLPIVFVMSFSFAAMLQAFLGLRQGFSSVLVCCFAMMYGLFAMGHIFSIIMKKENMTIAAVVVSLIVIIIFGGIAPKVGACAPSTIWILYLSFAFWSSNTFNANEMNAYSSVYDVAALNDVNSPYGKTYGIGWNLSINGIGFAFLAGFVLRIISLLVLKLYDSKKQK